MLRQVITGWEDSGQFKQEGVVWPGFSDRFHRWRVRIRIELRAIVGGDMWNIKSK